MRQIQRFTESLTPTTTCYELDKNEQPATVVKQFTNEPFSLISEHISVTASMSTKNTVLCKSLYMKVHFSFQEVFVPKFEWFGSVNTELLALALMLVMSKKSG